MSMVGDMTTLTENGSERDKAEACAIGDWVSARNAPGWRAAMQECMPAGESSPWYFEPVFRGPNLLGFTRVE